MDQPLPNWGICHLKKKTPNACGMPREGMEGLGKLTEL